MIVILYDNCLLQLINRVANPLSRWPTGAAELRLKFKQVLSNKDLWIIAKLIRPFTVCFYMYLKFLLFIRLRCFETRLQNSQKQLLALSCLPVSPHGQRGSHWTFF
jgi:hypothetical protein